MKGLAPDARTMEGLTPLPAKARLKKSNPNDIIKEAILLFWRFCK